MHIQHAYDKWAGTYDTDENLTRDLDQKVIKDTFSNSLFVSILEIGCGTGKNTSFLSQIGRHVHAVDFSRNMIRKASGRIEAGNVEFSMVDLTKKWSCRDGAYDLIVCCLVLEHIENLSHIFSESARVLMPAGRFFINELHPFKQYNGTKARFEMDEETIEVEAFVHHISDFTNTAQAQGLKLVKCNEYWHRSDKNKPPRILSFLFER